MAGDWVKMRVWLSRDPRVIAMADELAVQRDFMSWLTEPFHASCKETAHEYVTRDVTVALCVTSLLVTWGTAREQGTRDGDDLVVKFLDGDRVSQVTGVPGFGAAMVAVGWLVEEAGDQSRLPKFFSDKVSPHERHGDNGAERQRRYRERMRDARNVTRNGDSDVTRDVTRYVREEKRREDKKPSPPTTSAHASGGGSLKMVWGKSHSDQELLDDSSIDSLFGAVVSNGIAHDTDEDRVRFAALVFNLRRSKSENRFGLLTKILEGAVINKFLPKGANPRDWRNRASDADLDRARKALRKLDEGSDE